VHRDRLADAGKGRRGNELALGGRTRTTFCVCCGGEGGRSGAPSVTVNWNSKRGRPGAGFCSGLRYGTVSSPCSTSRTCKPVAPVAGIVKLAEPLVVTDENQPVKALS